MGAEVEEVVVLVGAEVEVLVLVGAKVEEVGAWVGAEVKVDFVGGRRG